MSVKNLVENAIKENKVAIFSKTYCPYCSSAKRLFKAKYGSVEPIIFELDEMEEGPAIQQYLYQKTGQRTVPNIFVAQEHIGGCDDAFRADKKNKLAGLLEA